MAKRLGAYWLEDDADADGYDRCKEVLKQIKEICDGAGAPRGGAWSTAARVAWLAATSDEQAAVEATVHDEEERRQRERQNKT